MDGMNIVAGDLEKLLQAAVGVAEDIVAKKVDAAFGDASSAMPGSGSSNMISEAGDSVDKRIKDLSEKYEDFSDKVKANLHEYQQNESSVQGAMDSVGNSSALMDGTGAGSAVGAAAGRITNRMGGGGAAAGAAAGLAGGIGAAAAGHSYGSVGAGSDAASFGSPGVSGHSYGSVTNGSGDSGVPGESDGSFHRYGMPVSPGHFYGSVGAGSDAASFGSPGVSGHSYGSVTNGSGDFEVPGESDGSFHHQGIPVSPGDYSFQMLPNADSAGPTIENLGATNERTA